MIIEDLLKELVEAGGSDLHISSGLPPIKRVDGNLERMKYDSESWTKTSNTANGLTIELWVSSVIPRLVKLRISGATTVTLETSSDYALLWTNSTVASLLSYGIVSYEMYTSIYAGQLNIRTDGTIHIGYTRNLATNAYANIPSGTNFYWEKVLLLV